MTRSAPMSPEAALTRSAPRPQWLRELGLGSERRAVRYGYRVATLALLADPRTGAEVIATDMRITPLVGAAAWVAGMVNVRGLPLPVFDLAAALNVPSSDGSQPTRVLMLGKGDSALGLLIDGLPVALPVETAAAVPEAVPAALQPHLHGAFAQAGLVWLDFDHESFFSAHAAEASGQRAGSHPAS